MVVCHVGLFVCVCVFVVVCSFVCLVVRLFMFLWFVRFFVSLFVCVLGVVVFSVCLLVCSRVYTFACFCSVAGVHLRACVFDCSFVCVLFCRGARVCGFVLLLFVCVYVCLVVRVVRCC